VLRHLVGEPTFTDNFGWSPSISSGAGGVFEISECPDISILLLLQMMHFFIFLSHLIFFICGSLFMKHGHAYSVPHPLPLMIYPFK
jgi:hypothetical protein